MFIRCYRDREMTIIIINIYIIIMGNWCLGFIIKASKGLLVVFRYLLLQRNQ